MSTIYIKKKSVSRLIEGSISDTLNVEDKINNAPSINLVGQMTGIPQEGVIAYDGDEIPEGYEEIEYTGETQIITNDNGTAIKYPDGTMITRQRYSVDVHTWGEWGSMYSAKIGALPDFPVPFVKEIPTVIKTLETNNSNAILCSSSEDGSLSSLTKPGACQLVRPTSGNASTFIINIIAMGYWK